MRTNSRFARGFAHFHRLTPLAMGLSLGLATSAAADPAQIARPQAAEVVLDPQLEGGVPTGTVCNTGWMRCHAHVHATQTGHVKAYAAPQGWGPADLQSAYQIDP